MPTVPVEPSELRAVVDACKLTRGYDWVHNDEVEEFNHPTATPSEALKTKFIPLGSPVHPWYCRTLRVSTTKQFRDFRPDHVYDNIVATHACSVDGESTKHPEALDPLQLTIIRIALAIILMEGVGTMTHWTDLLGRSGPCGETTPEQSHQWLGQNTAWLNSFRCIAQRDGFMDFEKVVVFMHL